MPVADPRFAARRHQELLQETSASSRATRLEYLKPLIMFFAGAGFVVIYTASTAGNKELSGAAFAGLYCIGFAIQLVVGFLGLWAASSLWLGGIGPFGLSMLRLAGIYGVFDAARILASPLSALGTILCLIMYVILLAWLFELELGDSIILALITFLIKIGVGFLIVLLLMSS